MYLTFSLHVFLRKNNTFFFLSLRHCIHQSYRQDLQLLRLLFWTEIPLTVPRGWSAHENILQGGQSSLPRSWPLLTSSDIISWTPWPCLRTPSPSLYCVACMWLGQMFTFRDDTPPGPGNSCEDSHIAWSLSAVYMPSVRGVGGSPVGLWVGVSVPGAKLLPSAPLHIPLIS